MIMKASKMPPRLPSPQRRLDWEMPQAPSTQPRLRFSPLAWLKLMFFLHAGDTEIGGFGISAANDPLYIEEFRTLRQRVTAATVNFDDDAVADYFDDCVDAGLAPGRFARIWIHTHPGVSPDPSCVDEETFSRVFGSCDWSLMFIVGRTGRTYARLSFPAGPGAAMLLPVEVDWRAWGSLLVEEQAKLDELAEGWRDEYGQNIVPEPVLRRAMDLICLDRRDRPLNTFMEDQIYGGYDGYLLDDVEEVMQEVWR